MGDVLIFESDAFSLEAPVDERGVQYDLPLGDDIAAHFKMRFESQGTRWEILEPVKEDYGSVLLLLDGEKTFNITVCWIALKDKECWAVQFGQSRGCLGLFWKFRDDIHT